MQEQLHLGMTKGIVKRAAHKYIGASLDQIIEESSWKSDSEQESISRSASEFTASEFDKIADKYTETLIKRFELESDLSSNSGSRFR